jgi:hypothetical protein
MLAEKKETFKEERYVRMDILYAKGAFMAGAFRR